MIQNAYDRSIDRVTATDETATFSLKSKQTGTNTSTVTNVAKEAWTHNPTNNIETTEKLDVP